MVPYVARTPMKQARPQAKLIVRSLNAASQRGYLVFGSFRMPCSLGKRGVKALKREGDQATPRGTFRLRRVLYNADHGARPNTALAVRALRRTDGWCDSPVDRNYNRLVSLPYLQSAESLWREDGVYDIIVVLGYNDAPRIKRRGSAIFMHLARPGFSGTEGCVALRGVDLRRLLCRVNRRTQIIIDV